MREANSCRRGEPRLGVVILILFCIMFAGVLFAGYCFLSLEPPSSSGAPPALLPDNLRDRGTVLGMLVGDVGFVLPQTMVVNKDGRCFLKADHSVDPDGKGRFTMKIAREKDGYHVFASIYTWKLNSDLWLETGKGLVPVAQIH